MMTALVEPNSFSVDERAHRSLAHPKHAVQPLGSYLKFDVSSMGVSWIKRQGP